MSFSLKEHCLGHKELAVFRILEKTIIYLGQLLGGCRFWSVITLSLKEGCVSAPAKNDILAVNPSFLEGIPKELILVKAFASCCGLTRNNPAFRSASNSILTSTRLTIQGREIPHPIAKLMEIINHSNVGCKTYAATGTTPKLNHRLSISRFLKFEDRESRLKSIRCPNS